MKIRRSAWFLVLSCLAIPSSVFSFSGPRQDDKAMMDAMMKAAAPGEQHKQLAAALVGTWMVEGKMWMDPSQPPMATKGTATISSILGGRYMREDFSSEFMQMPFTGIGVSGYDNVMKQYVSSWIDNMGTGIIRLTGNFDSAANTYTYEGKEPDPMSGKEIAARMTVRVLDKNKHVVAFFSPATDGKWVKTMEITYTRK